MVPETKSAALATSKLILCNTSERPLVMESTLSKITRQRRNLKDFTCSKRPVACVAFIPSLSSATSSNVPSMASSVWQMAFTALYLQAQRVSDRRCNSRGCLSGCSSFCISRKITCSYVVRKNTYRLSRRAKNCVASGTAFTLSTKTKFRTWAWQ